MKRILVDELPKSCGENDCPFNYDTISCKALAFIHKGDYFERDEELTECLNGGFGRYSKCPLLECDPRADA